MDKLTKDVVVLVLVGQVCNRFCEKGHDDIFVKNPRYLRPIKGPKFCGFKRIPIV